MSKFELTQFTSVSFRKNVEIIIIDEIAKQKIIEAEKYFENSTGFLFVHLSPNFWVKIKLIFASKTVSKEINEIPPSQIP